MTYSITYYAILAALFLFDVKANSAENEWVIDAEIECPCGMVSMWYGAITNIPTGYQLCDGTGGTPDLQGRFIIAATGIDEAPSPTNLYPLNSVGGSITINANNLPLHTHGITAVGTDDAGLHTHTGGTTGTGAHTSHTHSLTAVANSHSHGINLNTQANNVPHTHPIPPLSTNPAAPFNGLHSHPITAWIDFDGGATNPGLVGENEITGNTVGAVTPPIITTDPNTGGHTHQTLPTNTGTPSVTHTHPVTGGTQGDSHGHGVSGTIGGGGHGHGVNIPSSGGHSHTVSGVTDTNVTPENDYHPPYYALYYICCVGESSR